MKVCAADVTSLPAVSVPVVIWFSSCIKSSVPPVRVHVPEAMSNVPAEPTPFNATLFTVPACIWLPVSKRTAVHICRKVSGTTVLLLPFNSSVVVTRRSF